MNKPNPKVQDQVARTKTKALCRAIEKIPTGGGAFDARKAFGIFLQHTLCSLVGANRRVGEPLFMVHYHPRLMGFQPIDPAVPFPNIEEIGAAQRAYLEAVQANAPFTDLLTPVHAYFLGESGKGLGQFFTPWDLSSLVGGIAVDHQKRHGPAGRLRVSDPCCGAGGLLLAYIHERAEFQGEDWDARLVEPGVAHDLATNVRIHANDIDPACAAMTALQLTAAQFIHMAPLAGVHIEVGTTLVGERQVVYKSMSRFAVPGGVSAMGSKLRLTDLMLADFYRKKPGGRTAEEDARMDLVLGNPPFGAAANSAWGRVMGHVLASEKARKESAK